VADFEIRPIELTEVPAFLRTVDAAFGHHTADEDLAAQQALFEPNRSLAAFDASSIVGTAKAISFQLTLPGNTIVPAAGISQVGVSSTHRRRGIMRSLMHRQLWDIRDNGEALAILIASESVIYGRYGYGLSNQDMTWECSCKRTRFTSPDSSQGRITMIDKARARDTFPDVYERIRRRQPGAVDRSEAVWDSFFLDAESWRGGASEKFYAIHESRDGQVEGYATYRVKPNWERRTPKHELIVEECSAETTMAYEALWRWALSVDLVETVRAMRRPTDEPLYWMLTDPRRMVTTTYDMLWTRLIDVRAALESRRYNGEDAIVFAVTDDFFPDNSGLFRLETGATEVECRRTSGPADVELSVAELGATFLGGVRFSTLARAGRVVEHTPGALRRADAMFACEPAAWCQTYF
jgi:predicted acetyltransferase